MMTFDAAGAGWFVLEISLRALAAAAGVAVILRVVRLRAAAVLHLAWTAVLIAMLFMPVLPSIVPALPIPVPAGAAGVLGAASDTEQPLHRVVEGSTQAANDTGSTSTAPIGNSVRGADRMPASVTNARVSRQWLPLILLGVYTGGVLLLATRLLYGWSVAAAMIRRARHHGPIRVEVAGPVYQSSEVTVPMTVGAIHPVIVLPPAWKTWNADALAAIVAHESAHVRRRDALINLVAHVNRAIFWFHPLAWWLERKLAVTAEHACDEAAARAIAAPDRYAEILVEMANVARRHRGRLDWQAVGVNGAGLLDGRIDRLLGGDAFATASRTRKIAAAIGCFVALTAVVACRQQISAMPLREDPALAKRLVNGEEQRKKFEAARDMTQARADALEERLARNPEDFEAREPLVIYYRTSSKVAWDKKVPGLRRHALWLIAHYPEHDVVAPALSPQFDPEGFAAAKKLWAAHLSRPDVSPFLVYRAANFFAPSDKPYAERLILRGLKMDPESAALTARMPPDTGAYEWPMQLASLYAAALLGSESVWGTYNDLRTHLDWVNSPFAMHVREQLDTTSDARMLAHVGSLLTHPGGPIADPAIKQVLDEARSLGIRYLERAVTLEANVVVAKAALVRLRLPGHINDADRLASRAFESYMIAEDIKEFARKDMAGGKQLRDQAKAHAEAVLKLAAAHEKDPAYSAAVMTAHHVLATAALRDGDREGAVRHLRESVNVPVSERIQYDPPMSWGRPVNRLLKAGERERVVEFLEALARLTIVGRDRLLKDAQAIREGRMTWSYQATLAREGQ